MRYLKAALAILLCAVLVACTSDERKQAETRGSVTATEEFVRHFGPPPAVDRGTAYAFVIYFPSANALGKVVPFPFFSFDQSSLKKVALGKLVAGIGDMRSYRGEIAQPFAVGTRVIEVSDADGTATANFSKELLGAEGDLSLQNAVALTLRQFDGVSRVRMQVEGAPVELPESVAAGDQAAVVPLAAPRILSVTAMREKGESDVEEVDVFFDRPVQIKELAVKGGDGTPFKGDIYHSVFDMAGVLKPKDPTRFKSGMPVKVRWSVTDKLGRSSAGEREMPLEVKEH